MFLFEKILFSIGVVFLLFGFSCFVFSGKFFETLVDYDLNALFIVFGICLCMSPCFLNLVFNRCEVCQKYISTDYCTECGSYVAGDSLCSCGEILVDGYSFCPSCGCEVEVSFD